VREAQPFRKEKASALNTGRDWRSRRIGKVTATLLATCEYHVIGVEVPNANADVPVDLARPQGRSARSRRLKA
jgi:hypothetical protein